MSSTAAFAGQKNKLVKIHPKWWLPRTFSTFSRDILLTLNKICTFFCINLQSCRTGAIVKVKQSLCWEVFRVTVAAIFVRIGSSWIVDKIYCIYLIYDERTHINSFTTSAVMNRKLNIYTQKSWKYVYLCANVHI